MASLAPNDPNLTAEAWAELALLLDARGDYDGAWEAVGRGKRLQLERDAAERRTAEHVLGRFARLADEVTPEQLRRWHDAGSRFSPRRLALLTGVPRSGTTLLEQILDSHPDIVSSEEKDVLASDIFPAIGRGLRVCLNNRCGRTLASKSTSCSSTTPARFPCKALARRAVAGSKAC